MGSPPNPTPTSPVETGSVADLWSHRGIPQWVKSIGMGGGFLLSAFAGRFPVLLQDTGLLIGAVLALACGAGTLLHLARNAKKKERSVIPVWGMATSAFVFLICLIWYFYTEHKAGGQAMSSDGPARLLTLQQLFETDWPALPAYYMESEIQLIDTKTTPPTVSKKVKVAWRLNGDFVARSKFLSFYIDPSIPVADAQLACQAVGDGYQFFLDTADSKVDIAGQGPDDTAPTHLKDMVFSRRIFIYYGNEDFSLAPKGAIEDFYTQRGLSVQIFDAGYAWSHRDDKRSLRKVALVPNSLLIPETAQVPIGMRITAKNLSPPDTNGK